MKRDMDLCREILLCVEAREGSVGPEEVKIDGYTTDQIGYHAKLLADAGLLEGKSSTGVGQNVYRFKPRRLTWKGHEFLDAARDVSRWKQAKSIVLARVGQLSFDALKPALTQLVQKALDNRPGLGTARR